VGRDPSTGEKGKLYGISILDAVYMRCMLLPYDLSEELQAQIITSMIDVLAFPHSSVGDDTNEAIDQATEVIEAIFSTQTNSSTAAPSLSPWRQSQKLHWARLRR